MEAKRKLKIKSDFIDYYDYLSSSDSNVEYNRNTNNRLTILEGLSRLRGIGIATIETKAVRQIQSEYLILHNEYNSTIMKKSEAELIYPNSLASECASNNLTIYRLLQIGKRRFKVILKLTDSNINDYSMVSIEEIAPMYNIALGFPIYSIDYKITQNGLFAIRVNNIENLKSYDIDKIISPDEIMDLIYDAMMKYNKL